MIIPASLLVFLALKILRVTDNLFFMIKNLNRELSYLQLKRLRLPIRQLFCFNVSIVLFVLAVMRILMHSAQTLPNRKHALLMHLQFLAMF